MSFSLLRPIALALPLFAVAALGACGSSSGSSGSEDAGVADGAVADSAATDGGATSDGAVTDAASTDGGRKDAGCTVNECGSPPLVAACPGGIGPKVVCEAQATGTCGWTVSPCPSPGDTDGTCGGRSGVTCKNPSDFCNIPEVNACGATDGGGNCTPRPASCVDPVATVCGCDGMSYDNACEAARAGVSIGDSKRGCRK
jgi:hypothetical protein